VESPVTNQECKLPLVEMAGATPKSSRLGPAAVRWGRLDDMAQGGATYKSLLDTDTDAMVAGVSRDDPEDAAGPRTPTSLPTVARVALAAMRTAAQVVDAAEEAAEKKKAAQLRQYGAGRFVVRLLAPQVMLLLLLVLLYYLCYGAEPGHRPHENHIHLTVGPGCVAPPKTDKPPTYAAAEDVTCDLDAPRPHLGPVVTMRGGGDWKTAFKPVPITETTGKSRTFHYNATFTTKHASCVERAKAGTVGHAPTCNGGPECTVQYYTGEFFIATSPGWLKATSFGLLSADSSYVNITLVQGWDDCMPTPPRAPETYPVDALFHWMLESSGQSGGYLARRHWNQNGTTGSTQDSAPKLWDALDLATCKDGTSVGTEAPCSVQEYQPSGQLQLFLTLYAATTVAIVGYLQAGYKQRERMQSGNFKKFARVFFPHSTMDPNTQRMTMIAAWCRHKVLGSDYKTDSTSLHAWFAKFFTEELKVKAVYTEDSRMRFGLDPDTEADSHVSHPEHREVNCWLSKKKFVKHFKPCLKQMRKDAREHASDASNHTVATHSCAPLWHCLLCRDFDRTVCEDLFDQISGEDDYVSLDELERFILFFCEHDESDDDSDDDDDDHSEALGAMNDEDTLLYVGQHTHFHDHTGVEGGDHHTPITGVNALMDFVMGGPDKVIRSWNKILLTATLQSIVVIMPLLLPSVMTWLRARDAPESDDVYASERAPIVGRTVDMQDFTFTLTALIIGFAMAENVMYIVTGRELLRPSKEHRHERLDCLFVMSGAVRTSPKINFLLSWRVRPLKVE